MYVYTYKVEIAREVCFIGFITRYTQHIGEYMKLYSIKVRIHK